MKAIKTVYKGNQFRSRLEAKWAAFFDLCGWDWTYEPFDLDGYIPDFVLNFHKPIIVEVKPMEEMFESAIEKIKSCGWENEALVVGADLKTAENVFAGSPSLGLLRQSDSSFGIKPEESWAMAIFQTCQSCHCYSFFHEEWTWSCRVNGCYDGDHFISPIEMSDAKRLLAKAGATVQWNP